MKRGQFLVTLSWLGLIKVTSRAGMAIPVELRGGRFFAIPSTIDGRTFACWLDTDGGGFVFSDAVERFGLLVRRDGSRRFARLPSFLESKSLPALPGSGELRVIDRDPSDPILQGFDAQLGGTWFANRAWRFDYPNATLTMIDQGMSDRDAIDVAFDRMFPRIPAKIEGEVLTMSFDTAASIANPKVPGAAGVDATSFIPRARLERWRSAHPDWVVEDVAPGVRTIRVPRVVVGETKLPNVVFSTRPQDDVFQGDRVDGKLGANAFATRVVTIDYRRRRLWIE